MFYRSPNAVETLAKATLGYRDSKDAQIVVHLLHTYILAEDTSPEHAGGVGTVRG